MFPVFISSNNRSPTKGIQFDVTDPDFTIEAIRLAPSCPILLFSILALSAYHMSRFSRYDVTEAEEYHDQCVKLMLSMLGNKQLIADGAALAFSTLLRFYEEVSGKHAPRFLLKACYLQRSSSRDWT